MGDSIDNASVALLHLSKICTLHYFSSISFVMVGPWIHLAKNGGDYNLWRDIVFLYKFKYLFVHYVSANSFWDNRGVVIHFMF